MSSFFDRLAKSIAGVEIFGGTPAGSPRALAILRSFDGVAVEAGPAGTYRSGSELTSQFSTTSTLPEAKSISFKTISRRDIETSDSQARAVVEHTDGVVATLEAFRSGGNAPRTTVRLSSERNGQTEIDFTVDDDVLRGTINGRALRPISRRALVADASGSIDASVFRLEDESELPEVVLPVGRADELRAIGWKAQREIPKSIANRGSLSMMDAVGGFPGCSECLDSCDEKQTKCIARCFVEAAACGPFYGVCLAGCGSSCLGDDADCTNACHASGGACCPRKCEAGNHASCCESSDDCCGPTCCPTGICCGWTCCAETEHCGNPDYEGRGICCPNDGGPVCGGVCCQRGEKCADPVRGYCCAEDAGEYCLDQRGLDRCCPPHEVCADRENGICCPRDHGPVCVNKCCRPGEVCDGWSCCDPSHLCGPAESAVCCTGVCHDGKCCEPPYHQCGDRCCSPFAPCCLTRYGLICCGDFETCTVEGCCPQDRLCGSSCCPDGQHCVDAVHEICEPCPDFQIGCSPERGRPGTTICCPPDVNCCEDRCCEPGEVCCTPLDGRAFGCHPPRDCYVIK